MICHKARQVEDFWYLATISFHAALSACGFAGIEFKSFIVKSFILTHLSLPVVRPRPGHPNNSTQFGGGWTWNNDPGLDQTGK